MTNVYKSGFVTLIGRPNVGKSTLMNLYVGEKISIVTNKPQTTRNKIRSILTGDDYQIVFIDTPGIHKPATKLGTFMVKSAEDALNEVDVILYLVEPAKKISPGDLAIIELLQGIKTPVLLIINKIDTVPKSAVLQVIEQYAALYPFAEIFPISATKADNTDRLLDSIRTRLPEGPQYFPDDMITDQPERQIAAEIIREKALTFLQEEIPHGTAVEIQSMKKRKGRELVDIEATIYCEKESHKGIIIGKSGEMLKKIGATARQDIEALLGSPINLQLWVKVRKNWRDSEMWLRNLGYADGR